MQTPHDQKHCAPETLHKPSKTSPAHLDYIMIPVYTNVGGAVQENQDLLWKYRDDVEVLPLGIVMPIRPRSRPGA